MEHDEYTLPLGMGEAASFFELTPPDHMNERAHDAADFFALKMLRKFRGQINIFPMDKSTWEHGDWREGWDIYVTDPEVNRALVAYTAEDIQETIYMRHGVLVPFKIGVIDVD